MKREKLLSLTLLSLFVFSALIPLVITKADLTNSDNPTRIYRKTILDVNGDKIDDAFTREIEKKGEYIIDAVLTFDHMITSRDRFNLFKLGVTNSGEFWDQGRRTLITTTRDNLANIASLNGLVSISSGEKRIIIVAILGDDSSDLDALTIYKGARIYHSVGCAILNHYSGVENDINLLGDYTLIADTTDSRFYPTVAEDNYNNQYNPNVNLLASSTFLNATGMWNLGYEGNNVKVGNIDTGVNDGHKAINGRVIAAQSFVTIANGYDYDDLTTTDPHGHGSHTSGIILANDPDNTQNTGVAPEALLYFAKVGSSATLPSIIEALVWLGTTIKVSVINFSFGGTDTPGRDAIEIAFANVARNKKILACVSAGNEGDTGYYTIGSPGSVADVLTVGALNTEGSPPYTGEYYSSRAMTADDEFKPDVIAPGGNIYSLSRIADGYTYMSGTSMAAPHITGAVALLVQACFENGITVNPGVFKAALMKSSTEIASLDPRIQGRGAPNIGKAWMYILEASRVENVPLIGTLNPIVSPVSWWSTLYQGQVYEQYLTTVCSEKINKTLEATGTAAQFITIGSFSYQWSDVILVTYTIPLNATVGHYTGQFTFKFNETVLDTADISFDIAPSNGKRVLLNYRTTNWPNDHMYGQYAKFSEGLYDYSYALSEQLTYLDTGILNNYDLVWLPDPFSITFPIDGDINTKDTYNPWTEGEKTALTDFVASGGSVLIVFNGPVKIVDAELGTYYAGTNISTINDWTNQYGINVAYQIFAGAVPVVIAPTGLSPLTMGVTGMDHYGTYIEMSGDAVQISAYTTGSTTKAGAASYQHPSGGRVIAVSTNFLFDTIGYINGYNFGSTQNDVFAQNIVRWATAKHRIQRDNITVTPNGYATLRYSYLSGSGADFTGYVVKPDLTQAALTFTEVSTDIWEAEYNCTAIGDYEFYIECGTSGEEDFDYYVATISGTTPPTETGSIAPIIVVILTGFGLASWSLIARIKRN
ncbi:MAG: S8 family serine peptidase [Candidatus Heimdallarchaeota archaeon]|nr:S8 family serine peptidase [Candidatus Heimdallarchaeota archaeon]